MFLSSFFLFCNRPFNFRREAKDTEGIIKLINKIWTDNSIAKTEKRNNSFQSSTEKTKQKRRHKKTPESNICVIYTIDSTKIKFYDSRLQSVGRPTQLFPNISVPVPTLNRSFIFRIVQTVQLNNIVCCYMQTTYLGYKTKTNEQIKWENIMAKQIKIEFE